MSSTTTTPVTANAKAAPVIRADHAGRAQSADGFALLLSATFTAGSEALPREAAPAIKEKAPKDHSARDHKQAEVKKTAAPEPAEKAAPEETKTEKTSIEDIICIAATTTAAVEVTPAAVAVAPVAEKIETPATGAENILAPNATTHAVIENGATAEGALQPKPASEVAPAGASFQPDTSASDAAAKAAAQASQAAPGTQVAAAVAADMKTSPARRHLVKADMVAGDSEGAAEKNNSEKTTAAGQENAAALKAKAAIKNGPGQAVAETAASAAPHSLSEAPTDRTRRELPFAGIIQHQSPQAATLTVQQLSQAFNFVAATPAFSAMPSGAAKINTSAGAASQPASNFDMSAVGPRASSESAASVKFAKAGVQPSVTIEQVALLLKRQVKQGVEQMTLHLRPNDLGKVEIRLEFEAGKVKAMVMADHPATLEMLKADARALAQAINDAGVQTDSSSLEFQLRGEQHSMPHKKPAGTFGQATEALQGVVELAGDETENYWLTPTRVNLKV